MLAPILYYTNTWNSGYLPISSRWSYDKFGEHYNVTRILTDKDRFDFAKYQEYSPIFLPISLALSYGLSFAAITSTIVHSWIYYRKQILYQSRRGLKEQPDIHARLMSVYPEVPNWWYAIVFGKLIMLRGPLKLCH